MGPIKEMVCITDLGSCGVANCFGEGAEAEAQFQDPFRRPHPDSVRPDAGSHRRCQEEPIRRASICKLLLGTS